MTFEVLSKLSAAVKGGLDHGRWCWFMDENNQSGVAGVFDPEAFEYLQTGLEGGKPVRFSLHRNCRNTKEIVRQVHLWTGADIGRTEVTGRGAAPELIVVRDAESVDAAVEPVLRKLLDEGTSPNEIGLVTGGAAPPAFFSALPTSIRRALTPLTPATAASDLQRRIVWGPPSAFKGLERPIILVLAFEDQQWRDDAALYVASTRANFGLWLFASPTIAARLSGNQNSRSTANLRTR
jgi:hypothetical protein